MNNYLYIIFFSLIFSSYTQPLSTAQKIVAAAPITAGVHVAADISSTYTHELGHGIAGYLLKKADYKNYFYWADNPLKFLLFPLAGSSHSDFSEPLSDNQKIAHIAAGPLTGISTTYAQIIAFEMYRSYLETNQLSLTAGIKRPMSFYKDMSALITNLVWSLRNVKKLNANVSFNNMLLNGILFMRISRLIGEISYGLLPTKDSISIDGFSDYKGDGLNLWETIYKKYSIENGPKIKGNIFLLATIPALIACFHGAAKGLLTDPS